MAAPPAKEVRSDHANAASATTAPTPTTPLFTSVPRSSMLRRSEGSSAIRGCTARAGCSLMGVSSGLAGARPRIGSAVGGTW